MASILFIVGSGACVRVTKLAQTQVMIGYLVFGYFPICLELFTVFVCMIARLVGVCCVGSDIFLSHLLVQSLQLLPDMH
jgi:hypothetical protein